MPRVDTEAKELLSRKIAGVEIYWDADAFQSDGTRSCYLEVKTCHDELFQTAIDLRLATEVVVMERRVRPLKALREISSVAAERPSWWPANDQLKSRSNLLLVHLDNVGRKWMDLRARAEVTGKRVHLWHDDPALVQRLSGSSLRLCRTASVGHEGYVYYFVYPREREWAAAVSSQGFELFGTGLNAYRQLILEPGAIAG